MYSLLLEIGTEELPPGNLQELSAALGRCLMQELRARQFDLDGARHRCFATPRRLAVQLTDFGEGPPERREVLGPRLAAAFGPRGAPTTAALGFARKHKVGGKIRRAAVKNFAPDGDTAAEEKAWGKLRPGRVRLFARRERLAALSVHKAAPAPQRLPQAVQRAVAELPLERRMRWGEGAVEFVRPVHWVVLLLNKQVVPCEILRRPAGRHTRGHRFMAPQKIALATPDEYLKKLRAAKVIADFDERRKKVRHLVENRAQRIGGTAQVDEALLDEVSALVEWPVALAGQFEKDYLDLPEEILSAALQKHQRCFPVRNTRGALLPCFISVANIQSARPRQVAHGNERVVRPRLADAAFFYSQDRMRTLESQIDKLRDVVFHDQLGSLHDKSERLVRLTGLLAAGYDEDCMMAQQAARLSRADLLSTVVQEFDELQGVMGEIYALQDGLPKGVARALREQYLPRFAGDALPQSGLGRILAIAERLDTLAGLFGIGQPPSGSRDPFALRRAALGLVRILLDSGWDLDLRNWLEHACASYGELLSAEHTEETVLEYILERFSHWCAEEHQMPAGVRKAVFCKSSGRIADTWKRLEAVMHFSRQPEATALAAAHKRVGNLLQKEKRETLPETVHRDLLKLPAEQKLATALNTARRKVRPLLARAEYQGALKALAGLRTPVDRFFDEVLVMAEEDALRRNRLALLREIYDIFTEIADISYINVDKRG